VNKILPSFIVDSSALLSCGVMVEEKGKQAEERFARLSLLWLDAG
jgi:hypothetical protein